MPWPSPVMSQQRVPLAKECTLEELIKAQHIVLIRNKYCNPPWLSDSFVKDGVALVCRQALPADAMLPAADAAKQITEGFVGVISHGWLAPGHPDPASKRRPDIDQVGADYVFWDYLSLWQVPRSSDEETSFRVSLSSMHVIYAHNKWDVYRLLTIPDDSLNTTAYEKRGWCFFETSVGSVGASHVYTVMNGQTVFNTKSPVPLPPDAFAGKVTEMHFTSPKADSDAVTELYARIFPVISEHEEFWFRAWDDEDLQQFMTTLFVLRKVKTVYINNQHGGRASEAMEEQLRTMLAARGARLLFMPNGTFSYRDNLSSCPVS